MSIAANTRRRVIWIGAVIATANLLLLLLVGVRAVNHGSGHWLLPFVLLTIAIGLIASVMLRVALFVLDAEGRAAWWTNASSSNRTVKVTSIAVRLVAAIGLLVLALWTLIHQ